VTKLAIDLVSKHIKLISKTITTHLKADLETNLAINLNH